MEALGVVITIMTFIVALPGARDALLRRNMVGSLHRILALQGEMIALGRSILSEVDELCKIRADISPWERKYSGEVDDNFLDISARLERDVSKQIDNINAIQEIINADLGKLDNQELRNVLMESYQRMGNAQRILYLFGEKYIQNVSDISIGKKSILKDLHRLFSNPDRPYQGEDLIVNDKDRSYDLREASDREAYLSSARARLEEIAKQHEELKQIIVRRFGPVDLIT